MERNLLERISQGDTKAFESIYRDYYGLLCRFALQLLHSPALAEEVADDVMFYLWDHRRDLQIASLQPYLLRAVRNRSLNLLASPVHRHTLGTDSIADAERAEYLRELFDDDHPLEQLLYKEMQAKAEEAIASLPEECRRVFMKCRVEGKKYAEAAAELGISVNTVKYHLRNATATLSEALKQLMLLYILIR